MYNTNTWRLNNRSYNLVDCCCEVVVGHTLVVVAVGSILVVEVVVGNSLVGCCFGSFVGILVVVVDSNLVEVGIVEMIVGMKEEEELGMVFGIETYHYCYSNQLKTLFIMLYYTLVLVRLLI